ncbi:MAG: GH3 auxin-responsive promoter family protein [Saprospiraceae bacterium]|nr:GH3 auxin-responsive promoter family protein [Candidatus Vicinibacter affinis]
MSIKSSLIKATAQVICVREEKLASHSVKNQNQVFNQLIISGLKTSFGKDFKFSKIKDYNTFKQKVPLGDYEKYISYFERVKNGEPNVLWPGKPKYLAKTSGTTSGTKFIPITRASIPNHINSARNALFSYVHHRSDTMIFDGKMLFLSGSPELEFHNGIGVGRLSGIVNHEIPSWFSKAKLPDHQTNLIQPWELKVEKIIEDILHRDLRVVSGIPPWIQMFFEKILEKTGKSCVKDVFPNLELYIHGGVNYEPYNHRINKLVGEQLSLLETYPASEGFIAYQDNPDLDGMRLVSKSGIFFEFIPLDGFHETNPIRLSLEEVEINKDYAIVLSTNAGLWAYLLGDVVNFCSLNPPRLKVTGRVSQFISAFGEHVIASEVEGALSEIQNLFNLQVIEFTVAPQVNPSDNNLPYHEWFIEFKDVPKNLNEISARLNEAMMHRNNYYKDLINGRILDTLKIRPIKRNGFKDYMISIKKYGEQFKVQRLCNDRKIADELAGQILIS